MFVYLIYGCIIKSVDICNIKPARIDKVLMNNLSYMKNAINTKYAKEEDEQNEEDI